MVNSQTTNASRQWERPSPPSSLVVILIVRVVADFVDSTRDRCRNLVMVTNGRKESTYTVVGMESKITQKSVGVPGWQSVPRYIVQKTKTDIRNRCQGVTRKAQG